MSQQTKHIRFQDLSINDDLLSVLPYNVWLLNGSNSEVPGISIHIYGYMLIRGSAHSNVIIIVFFIK